MSNSSILTEYNGINMIENCENEQDNQPEPTIKPNPNLNQVAFNTNRRRNAEVLAVANEKERQSRASVSYCLAPMNR